jgi:RNA polymerase sigma-70 factor (ECF subfamily)
VPEPAAPGPSPAQAVSSEERARLVRCAFQNLPVELRETMTLFVYEDLGYREIADIANCSVKAVETRIYRARQLLKQTLPGLLS